MSGAHAHILSSLLEPRMTGSRLPTAKAMYSDVCISANPPLRPSLDAAYPNGPRTIPAYRWYHQPSPIRGVRFRCLSKCVVRVRECGAQYVLRRRECAAVLGGQPPFTDRKKGLLLCSHLLLTMDISAGHFSSKNANAFHEKSTFDIWIVRSGSLCGMGIVGIKWSA